METDEIVCFKIPTIPFKVKYRLPRVLIIKHILEEIIGFFYNHIVEVSSHPSPTPSPISNLVSS